MALARKLAVIMQRMWVDGADFRSAPDGGGIGDSVIATGISIDHVAASGSVRAAQWLGSRW